MSIQNGGRPGSLEKKAIHTKKYAASHSAEKNDTQSFFRRGCETHPGCGSHYKNHSTEWF